MMQGMTQPSSLPAGLLRLQPYWRAFGLILLALARSVHARCGAGGPKARAMAETLELTARCGLAELTRELRAHTENVDTFSDAERRAYEHLLVIASRLAVLILLAQYFKRALAGRSGAERKAEWAALARACAMALPARTIPFLDSS